MSVYTFQEYDPETHPIVELVSDWNSLIKYVKQTGKQ
jgi:hypothetical protein